MSNFHVALKKVVDDSYVVQIGCGLIDDMIQDIKEGKETKEGKTEKRKEVCCDYGFECG